MSKDYYHTGFICLRMDESTETHDAGVYPIGTAVKILERKAQETRKGNPIIICRVNIGVQKEWVFETELSHSRNTYEPTNGALLCGTDGDYAALYQRLEDGIGINPVAEYPMGYPVEMMGYYPFVCHVKLDNTEGFVSQNFLEADSQFSDGYRIWADAHILEILLCTDEIGLG